MSHLRLNTGGREHKSSRDGKRRVSYARVTRILFYAALSVWAVFSLFPIYWMFTTALKKPTIVMAMPPQLIPKEITLMNFVSLFKKTMILRWTANSAVVSVAQTLGFLLTSTMAGYAFAKKRFPGKEVIFWLLMSTMMIPAFVTLVTRYRLVSDLNMVDTYWGLILPELAGPMGVFMMRQFMQSLPSELFDAARMDGCGELGVFWRIVLPLSAPGIAVLGVFSFVYSWNDFIWPLVVTSSAAMRTLPVGLATIQHWRTPNFPLQMAGASYAALPMMIIFFAAQRFFLKGITIGALKG